MFYLNVCDCFVQFHSFSFNVVPKTFCICSWLWEVLTQQRGCDARNGGMLQSEESLCVMTHSVTSEGPFFVCVQGKHDAEVGFALGCNFTGTVLCSAAESYNSTEQHCQLLEADAVCLIWIWCGHFTHSGCFLKWRSHWSWMIYYTFTFSSYEFGCSAT